MIGELNNRGRVCVPFVMALGWAMASCAPAQPADDAQGSDSKRTKASTEEVAPLPPLERAPTPEGVVVRFRINSPAQLADSVLDAMSVPFDWRKALDDQSDTFGKISAVDWAAALEGAVVLNPEDPTNPSRFVSIGVQGVDEVLAQLEKDDIPVQEGPGGVLYFAVEDEPCAVGRSLGGSPARVVCSDQQLGLHHLVDYALRGLPAEELLESDAFVEVDARPVRQRYGKELQRGQLLASVGARQLHVGHPKLDRALTDAAIGLAEEAGRLAGDFQILRLSLDSRGGDFRASMQLSFDGRSSFVVRSLLELAAKQGAAPQAFGQLPSTVSSASYNREVSRERSAGWMSVLTDLVTGAAEHKGASPEFSGRLASLVDGLGPAGLERVAASGPLVQTKSKGKVVLRRAWMLSGSAAPQADVVQVLDDLSWLLASAEWKKIFPKMDFELPQLRRVNKKVPGVPGAVVFEWSIPKSLTERLDELDDGVRRQAAGFEWQETVADLAEGAVVVFQRDGLTWTSWATLEPIAAAAEAASALSTPGAEKVAQVPRYRPIVEQPSVASGFFTLAGVGGALWSFVPPAIAGDFPALLRATPGKGETPMTSRFWIETGETTTAHWSLDIPRDFTRDAATLGAMIAAETQLGAD